MARKSLVRSEKVLILDSDSSVYAIGFVTQKKTHIAVGVEGEVVYQDKDKRKFNAWIKDNDPAGIYTHDYTEDIEPVSHALNSAKKFIANCLAYTGCHRAVVLLTKGGDCFRHHLATIQRYKGNRLSMDKPHHYDAIRDYYMEVHGAKMYQKWEADDAACMALHKGSSKPNVKYILASIDKDLDQHYGLHVNPNKKDEGVYMITEVEGWYNFYIQMLMGDKADHIKGLSGKRGAPGIGKGKAKKLLAPAGDDVYYMCQIVYDQYVIKYGDVPFVYEPWWCDPEQNPDGEFADRPRQLTGTAATMFRENADLLYMLRTPDDQYQPHYCNIYDEHWATYPKGTVEHYLPTPKEGDDEAASKATPKRMGRRSRY